MDETDTAKLSADLINEFTEKSLQILKDSETNKERGSKGKKLLNSILLRDAGNKYPKVETINEKYSMNFSCIVDMPVEIGISNVLEMKPVWMSLKDIKLNLIKSYSPGGEKGIKEKL